MYDRIASLFHTPWLIHQEGFQSLLPLLVHFIQGGEIHPSLLESKVDIKAFHPATAMTYDDLGADNVPEGSIAIIPIQGVLYSWKLAYIRDAVRMALANDRIAALLFLTNSPGGQVTGTDVLAKEIAESTKPTLALIEGMAASAAMWLVAGCNYIMCTSPLDRLGSVGTMASYVHFDDWLKSVGIRAWDIYATKATRKNEEVRSLVAEPSDAGPITGVLDYINEHFHRWIRETRKADDEEVYTGAMFHAPDAIRLKLATGMSTMDKALEQLNKQIMINQLRNQKFHQ